MSGYFAQLKFIEIGQDSVLIQIQNVANPCVLTMTGEIILLAPPPAATQPSRLVVSIQQSVASLPLPASPLIINPRAAPFQPVFKASSAYLKLFREYVDNANEPSHWLCRWLG